MGIDIDLGDEVAVVTGAGRGLGEGIARMYARAGAAVVVAARRSEEIERVAGEIEAAGGRAVPVTTDVTDDEALDRLARTAVERFGRLSIWMNNAGGSFLRKPLVEMTRPQWEEAVQLNLTSVWAASTIAARHMDEGSILNISSLAAFGGTPGSGHYAACKAAVNSLTETLALELAPKIRVNAIAPGYIPTEVMMGALGLNDDNIEDFRRSLGIPLERFGQPDDIAGAALYLASPLGSWVTGQVIKVSGGH